MSEMKLTYIFCNLLIIIIHCIYKKKNAFTTTVV